MKGTTIRRWLAPLRHWPIHPQWLVFRHENEQGATVSTWASGLVLDVGAGRQSIRQCLPKNTRYLSLDYWETGVGLYHSRPDVFGDAQNLPIATASVDTVLLLDVLEHLPRPMDCLTEIRRVLKPGGRLILQVPFLYPPHDEPHDYQRWTIHGLRRLARENGFHVVHEKMIGRTVETAALLANLSLGRRSLKWITGWYPEILLLPLIPLVITAINLLGWAGGAISRDADYWMAHGCRMVWEKPI